MRRHHLATLVVTLALVLTPPVSGRPQDGDVVVLEALPFALPPSPLEAPAAGTTLGATVQDPEGPRLRSSQGPEGFAYESSHPVLDAYGALTTATQYHAQDGLGRYRYSYRQPGSTREEYVDENGRIQGSYSYEMPNEEKVSLTYYADDTGFHVKRAVLPNLAAQAPRDEPEVAAIKAAHMRLWRRMWARAAAASVGAPYDPLELEAEVFEPAASGSLESDIISSDPSDNQLTEEVTSADPTPGQAAPPADPVPVQEDEEEEVVVPIFPGGPDAPSVPVSSAPKPLTTGAAGLSIPDSETVVVTAARDGDFEEFSAPSGDQSQQQFNNLPQQRVGALRLRGALPFPSNLSPFVAAASEPSPTRVDLRTSDPAAPGTLPSPWLTRVGGALPAPAVRVSDEAARAGLLPVAERHSLAQVRPSQRRPQDEVAPLLDDPVLYEYSSLLHAARQQAAPPRIVVV